MKRERVPVNASQAGLNDAFAHLHLPEAPEPPASEPEQIPTEQDRALRREPGKVTGRVVLRRETAHRAGKTVVVVGGFDESISEERIADLGKRMRSTCGCGGGTKGREIELQGEQVKKARSFLEKEGFRVAGERG